MFALDHIAVSAETLAAGAARVEDALGVTLQPGGQHPLMGTHNSLLGLEEGLYLEVIAVDPDAPAPGRPRWFDLDGFRGAPRLTNWICRTDDLDAMLARLGPGAGRPVAVSRGDLRWRMAVPDDGKLPHDQAYPALIQWEGTAHPAARLSPSGCRLTRLTVRHPRADEVKAAIAPLLDDGRVEFATGTAGFEAVFDTPGGERVLR